MDSVEWSWNTREGLEMYAKAWVPAGEVKGVACILHAVGDHIGRYEKLAEAIALGGYVSAGFDLRGFGRSEGMRGHTPSLDAYFDDIDSFLAEITQRYPNQHQFLMGMSMGAILALAYTPLRQPAILGVVALSPGLENALQEQKAKVLLAKLLGTVLPTLTLESGVDPEALSRDPQAVHDFVNDPLVHFQITTAWGKAMLRAVDLAYENAHRFPKPLLLMHGSQDEIAYPRGSQAFFELAPQEKATLVMWEGFKHDLTNDLQSAEVFTTVVDWLDQHC